MVGCVIGVLALVMVFKIARRAAWVHGAWHGAMAYGPPWARGWQRHGHGGWRRRMGWAALAYDLRLDEQQEDVVRKAVREVRDAMADARPELRKTRQDLAKAVRADSFDAEVLGLTFARHDEELERLRKAVVGALARAHAVLDERQRERLASHLERGLGRLRPDEDGPGFGPYR